MVASVAVAAAAVGWDALTTVIMAVVSVANKAASTPGTPAVAAASCCVAGAAAVIAVDGGKVVVAADAVPVVEGAAAAVVFARLSQAATVGVMETAEMRMPSWLVWFSGVPRRSEGARPAPARKKANRETASGGVESSALATS